MRLRATKLHALSHVRRRAALWTPAALGSSLVLWVEAYDPTTIVSFDTINVAVWVDKSGNDLSLPQATEINQPNYNEIELNAKPAVTFNGSEWFEPRTVSLSSFSLMMVAAASQNTATAYYPIGFNVGAAGISIGGTANNQKFTIFDGTTALSTPQSSALNTPAIVYAASGGGSREIAINGNTPTTDNVSQSITQISVGRRGDATLPFFGALSLLVLTNNRISVFNKQRLDGYSAWVSGTQANLPSGHPFRNRPPTM